MTAAFETHSSASEFKDFLRQLVRMDVPANFPVVSEEGVRSLALHIERVKYADLMSADTFREALVGRS